MTVKQLIEVLETCNPDLPIYSIAESDYGVDWGGGGRINIKKHSKYIKLFIEEPYDEEYDSGFGVYEIND